MKHCARNGDNISAKSRFSLHLENIGFRIRKPGDSVQAERQISCAAAGSTIRQIFR